MQAKYTQVQHLGKTITAIDSSTGAQVTIQKSIAVLYQKYDTADGISYTAITYNQRDLLRLIENFIRGGGPLKATQALLLSGIVVRFGWLDKTLGQLEWVPLVDLVDDFVNRELGPTEKGKFQEICKVLSLSIREARKLHVVGDIQYRPKKLIANILYGLKTAKTEVA